MKLTKGYAMRKDMAIMSGAIQEKGKIVLKIRTPW